jgi:hypothetical protein
MWIGLIASLEGPKTYSWLWRAPQYDIEFASGHQTTFDTSKSHENLAADVTTEWQREAERLKARDPRAANEILQSISTKRDELMTGLNSRYETAGEKAKRIWLASFVPPIALLGLGLCIAWIAQGFRARR